MYTSNSLYQTNTLNKSRSKYTFTQNKQKHKQQDNGFKKNKPDFKQNTKAVLGGVVVYSGFKLFFSNIFNRSFVKAGNKVDIDTKTCNKAVSNILKENGLKDTVKILHVNKDNAEDVVNKLDLRDSLKTYVRKSDKLSVDKKISIRDIYYGPLHKTFNRILDRENRRKIINGVEEIANGNNASYNPFSKIIAIPDKKPALIFHEIGHAISLKSAGLFKIATKTYAAEILPVVILANGLLHNKKDKEDKSFGSKVLDFAKDNCGKLAFIAAVPTLYEEAKASVIGLKKAKPHLNTDSFKALKKSYGLAYLTYFSSALLTAGAIKLAVNFKDKIANEK